MTKLDPVKVWWLVAVMVLMPPALADASLKWNITTSDGAWSAYSEGIDHKLYASSEDGPSEYVGEINLANWRNSSAMHGLIASKKAKFSARSPEYSVNVRDASDFYGVVTLSRESEPEEIRDIITEVPNGSLVTITTTVHTTAGVDTDIRGNGSFAEDISVAYAGKGRALKLRELDGFGRFNLSTSLRLDGTSTKRDFGMLNESEKLMDLGTELAYDHETGVGPMGGI